MTLPRYGVDPSVTARWLGHGNVETTSMYPQADMQLEEDALEKIATTKARTTRCRTSDRILAFLNAL